DTAGADLAGDIVATAGDIVAFRPMPSAIRSMASAGMVWDTRPKGTASAIPGSMGLRSRSGVPWADSPWAPTPTEMGPTKPDFLTRKDGLDRELTATRSGPSCRAPLLSAA